MQSIFREYDIRGIFEKELTQNSVTKIGYFLGLEVKKYGEYVSIGYDARSHSKQLFEWLASGFNRAGVKVLNNGLVPTPVNYFSNYAAFDGITPSASVMITGSHNPPEYNGFKITLNKAPFFGEQIYELGRKVMQEELVIEDDSRHKQIDALQKYIDYMVEEFALLRGAKNVVLDFGNGAASVALLPILDRLEVAYEALYPEPDGMFPNHHPDPSEEENLEDLKDALKEGDIGFAFDGDGDRIALLTKKHNIKGDVIATIFAKRMENPLVIGEVKCSQVMYDEINKIGRAVMYKTGHSNLKVKLKELDATFAAEVSGHIFFNDRYFGYDDAIYSALRILELRVQGVDFDMEAESLPKVYNTEEIKVKTTEEKKFLLIEKLKELLQNPPVDFPKIREIITVDGLRIIFDHGWALVRASNTTPILVTRFEGDSLEAAKEYQEKLNVLIEDAKRMFE